MGDNEPGEARDTSPPPQENPPDGRTWITRHPVLSAILVPVIAGLIVLVPDKYFDAKQSENSASHTPSSEQPSRTEPTDRPSASAPASSPTSASVSSEDIRWSGTVSLTFLDLDSVPPKVLSGNNAASTWVNYSYHTSNGTLYGHRGKPTIALWGNPAKPTRQQCADVISTQGVESLELSKSSSYCVKTAADRVAFITELSFNNASYAYTAAVTVWSPTN